MKKVVFLTVALVGFAFVGAQAQDVKKADAELQSRPVDAAGIRASTPTVQNNNANTQTPQQQTTVTPASRRTAIISENNRVQLDPARVPTTQPVKRVDGDTRNPNK